MRHFHHSTDLGDGHALCDQRLSGLDHADVLLRSVPGAFYGEVKSMGQAGRLRTLILLRPISGVHVT